MSVINPGRGKVIPDYFTAAFAAPSPANTPTISVLPYVLNSGETLIRETRTATDGPADMVADPHFRYDGAMALPGLTVGIPLSFVVSDLLTGGAAQAARYQMRVQTNTSPVNRVKFRMRAAAASMSFRIKVNGAWVTQANTRVSGLTAGSTYSVQLDFPTNAARHIEYEDSGGNGFGGVAVALGATLTRPAEPTTPVRLAILGDSYSGGAGQAPGGAGRMETWPNWVAKLMRATSFINFGIGGTGYTTTNPFGDRVADIVAFNPTHVIVFGSRNDGGGSSSAIQTAAANVLSGLASIPNVYVSGPSTSGFAGNNTSVKAAAVAAGRPFLDGIAASWISNADLGGPADVGSDGTNVHPTFNGHQKIARGYYEAMQAVGETPLVYVATPTVLDDFNRADTTTFGSTPTGGATWASAGAPTSGIASNQAYCYTGTTSVGYRFIPGPSATGQWDVDVPVVGTSKAPKFVFNYTDGNNHFRVYGNGTNWVLMTRTTAGGNVDTLVSSVPVANGDHIRVTRDSANLVTVKINSTTIYSATNTANASAVIFGMAGSNTNTDTRWDTISYTPLLS